jgi:hypothetical protein
MSCTGTSNCECGCCAGISVQTPQVEKNRAGLPAISYRVGSWATFKESMLARLSSSDYPALTELRTRDDDDFTIAFLDATSVVMDILTFYQERLANESYLRTAVQLRSLTELSRLIGYEPAPGVSASSYVAFTLKTAPGQAPDPSAPAITIPQGTQMQSVPAQGQSPQTFETLADIPAKPDWNALQVQTGVPWLPQISDLSVYLQGVATQLQPGDLILIVGDERLGSPTSNNWDVRVVTTVRVDGANNRTYVAWSEGLGYKPTVTPAQKHPKFYALRQRTALFGYNAISPLMLDPTITGPLTPFLTPDKSEWFFDIRKLENSNLVDLDAAYSKIVPKGWMILIRPDAQTSRSPSGFITLYQIESVSVFARADFAMSAKISRIATDTNVGLGDYYNATRNTSVVAQSEQLAVAEQPLTYPLYGTALDLETLRPDLVGLKVVAISGKRQKLSVMNTLTFVPDDQSPNTTLNPGDLLTLTDPTPLVNVGVADWSATAGLLTLNVEDASGRPGTVSAHLTDFLLAASGSSDPEVSEYALVTSVTSVNNVTNPFPHTLIILQSSLLNCYERRVTTVNANVALATHGQSVSEVMGSGSASTPNQSFTLKQSPLTYVQAPTPTGRLSTLQVPVNGVKWTEVPTLYQQGPSQQVFKTLNQADATTEVIFGDGVEGSRLPTGQNNVQANYRVGSGSGGNVAAGSLTTLVDRPLGVSGVTNPESATGGQDAQSISDVRSNAPQTVLTLGRAVSITDYQSYAATFAGIAKAYAIWIPAGPGRGVFLTVAGVDGAELQPGNPTLTNLVTSLKNYGNPLIPITAVSFLETLFGLSADVQYDPAFDQPTVHAQVLATLSQAYSFANRTFGQGVSVDEVATIIQAVPGVVAVNVKEIHTVATSKAGDLASQGGAFTLTKYANWLMQHVPLPRPFSDSPTRICPYLPVANLTALPYPAEILVLDPDPKAVNLGVMS